MKKVFTTLFLAVSLTTIAQQDPQFSQNMWNRLQPNPGFAGANGGICATLLGRMQWVGFDGAPKTYLLNVDGYIAAIRGGVGLSVMSDNIGVQKGIAAKLSYAYKLNLGTGSLGIGADVGILMSSLDGSKLVPAQGNDNSIPTGNSSSVVPDFGLGLYYQIPEKLYFGVSTTHLVPGTLKYSNVNYKVARHYYLMAGYTYNMTQKFDLIPSIFIKTDGKATQFDINLNVMYNKLIWLGASYRLQDAAVAMAGVQWKNFRLGYSYDFNTSKLNAYNSGTHELMLGYCFKLEKPAITSKYKNTRYL
ncbi:MAG: type IX secretion system membrane protein PorP/SprF [Bacteroidia bacterium]|nr:type IX secretion system membrane protein PorP/SprF [Bacteroidia bacterium]